MASTAVLETVQNELGHYPGVELEIKSGGKHDRAIFRIGERSRFLTIPKTPSDHRAEKNIVRDLKKTLDELGVERQRYRPGSRQGIGGRPRAKKPRAGGRGLHYHAEATLGLAKDDLTISIPMHSPLLERFRTPEGRPVSAWRLELRSSVDLAAPPHLVLKKAEIRPGLARERSGIVRGGALGKHGGWKLVMRRNNLPKLLKRLDPFSSVELKLRSSNSEELEFDIPQGVIPTSYDPNRNKPEPVQEPVEALQEREETVEVPEVAKAAPVPSTGLADKPIVLQFPKQAVSVEQAIRVLNVHKQKLGSNLRFTVTEGGFLTAVHRIGH